MEGRTQRKDRNGAVTVSTGFDTVLADRLQVTYLSISRIRT
jgi:hypothetical protein